MAVALTAQVIPCAGAAITYKTTTDGLAASGNTAPCRAGLGLLFRNRSGGALDLTVNVRSDASFDGMPIRPASCGQIMRLPYLSASHSTSVMALHNSASVSPSTVTDAPGSSTDMPVLVAYSRPVSDVQMRQRG
jgi:hypothetical protein